MQGINIQLGDGYGVDMKLRQVKSGFFGFFDSEDLILERKVFKQEGPNGVTRGEYVGAGKFIHIAPGYIDTLVVRHEFGHYLGYIVHSKDEKSIMFRGYSPSRSSLTDEDVHYLIDRWKKN